MATGVLEPKRRKAEAGSKKDDDSDRTAEATTGAEEGEGDESEAEPEEGDVHQLGGVAEGYFDQEELAPAPSSEVVASGPLQQYMAEIGRYPLLNQEEEVSLARKYQEQGDLRAAYTLVLANLRLVVKIAYEFRRSFANLMDLIQEGNIGLMKAVEKFDPYRGVKLSSYAAWWIRAYIIRYVLNNWSLVKIGTTQNQRRLFFNLKKAKAELEEMGFRPEPKLIASRLNVKEEEVVEMERRLSGSDISLDAPLDDESDTTRIEFVAYEGADAADRLAAAELQALLKDKLAEFREGLDERERAIFDLRLLAEQPMTLRELGDEFGVSRERIRQLESDLKKRIGEYLRQSEGLGDVYSD